ncbi:MAG: hypothetical protein RIT27_430 [Pseudomonadota bacterium]|jgi:two-component system nitrogen regulation sensor histidine kinase GlnL
MELAQRILDNLMTAVLWFDRDLSLQYINPAGETLLQLSANQVCGLHAEILFPDCPCFQRLITEPRTLTEHGLKIGTLTGSQMTVDCSITPIRNPHFYPNNNNGLGIIPPDAFLVEMVNVDQQLRLTREEDLSLRRRAVHNLLRGLAHEIKNPLGGLRGAAQLLARELPLQQREYTDIIIGEADRLQTLLDRMLGPRTPPRKEWINIHKVLCLGRQLITNESGELIEIIEDYDPSVPDIFADPDQLHQAFLNLLRNAVQAMNGQGVLTLRTRIEHRVKLDNKLHKMAVRVDIQDNGPGIPEEIFEHIFYPMVTGRAEGTGLGLTIAQNLVHRNGGTISCESRPTKTVFTISLPITT